MKNPLAVASIGRKVKNSSEQICDIAFDITCDDVGSVLGNEYDQLLLDELEKLQSLVLLLTEVVTQGIGNDEHSDEAESAFSAGELTSVMGSKSHDEEDE